METTINYVLSHFFSQEFLQNAVVTPQAGGHVNRSFKVKTPEGNYLLQSLNGSVFTDPISLMKNTEKITDHLRKKIIIRGGDPERETERIIYTKDGAYGVQTGRDFWRLTTFIDNTETYETIDNPEIFEECARAFGTFQQDLADFPAHSLVETIPNFHHTPSRYQQFEFVKQHRNICSKLTDMLAANMLPLRVTHNDTKLNNILYDITTHRPICIIDLDTTMPGLVAYDFGDSIRGGAGTAAEDEQDISKVGVSLELFEAYTKGFLETVGNSLTEAEKSTLPDGAILMTLECGMRFLTDYLHGDVYFHTAYPTHNLVRARNMFKMVADMEAHRRELDAIIDKYR